MLLKFTQKSQPYNSGEIADFSDPVAKRLLASGVAVIFREKTREEPKPDQSKTPESPVNRKMKARVKK